ncbi:hypothetical protein [Sphingomonas sp. HMP6]|nr:hypothetical protein [Sphingomonas sp. HMP6]
MQRLPGTVDWEAAGPGAAVGSDAAPRVPMWKRALTVSHVVPGAKRTLSR